MYSDTYRGKHHDGTTIIACPDSGTPRSYLLGLGGSPVLRTQCPRDFGRPRKAGRRPHGSVAASGKDVCDGSYREILGHHRAADLFANPPSRDETARIRRAAATLEPRVVWDRDLGRRANRAGRGGTRDRPHPHEKG